MRTAHALAAAMLLLPRTATAACDPSMPPAFLTPTDPVPGIAFGNGVAISAGRVVVGVPGTDRGDGNRGVVQIFAHVGADEWAVQETLTPPAGEAAFQLGASVAVEGDTIVAGAPGASPPVPGSAHVFTWDGSGWSHQALRPTTLQPSHVGHAVSISGDRLIVGGPQWSGRDLAGGAAWIYARSGGTWTLEAELIASDARTRQFFGQSVDISGDRAVVGAPQILGTASVGAAYVFERVGGAWIETARIEPSTRVLDDEFGSAVALEGDTLVATSTKRFLPGSCGAAFHFEWNGSSWTEIGFVAGAPSASCPGFGSAAALSGDLLAVGEYLGVAGTFAVHLFVKRGGRFRALPGVMAPTGIASGGLGPSCAVDQDLIVAGAPGAHLGGTGWQGLVFLQPICVESDCADAVDDDGDGPVDCADEDCRSPACPEVCDDSRDGDGDDLVDCDDPDCFSPACDENCLDGLDNDEDGAVDCADDECSHPTCPESCADGRDNDADGLVDCRDPSCFGGSCPEICDDTRDNDRDGRIDCRDADCVGQPGPGGITCETTETLCGDGGDNDGDSRTDCADGDCAGRPGPGGATCEPTEVSCGDGGDNDADGAVDCADPDCSGVGTCPCYADSAPPGVAVWRTGSRLTACGGFPPPTWSHAWDWDRALDGDGDGDPCNDVQATGCDVRPSWSFVPGLHGYCYTFTWASGFTRGGGNAFVVPAPRTPVPAATAVACEGDVAQLSCGVADRCAAYSWDLDVAVDSSGNGDPDDDEDAIGCETMLVARSGPVTAAVTARVAHPLEDETGVARSVTVTAAAAPAAPVPGVTLACAGDESVLDCGAAAPGVGFAWDLDASVDSDGDGDASDDADAVGCRVAASLDAGPRTVTVTATSGAGCRSSATLVLDVPGPAVPAPSAVVGCATDPVSLTCGSSEPTVTWDLDVAADSDGNGSADDDVDASGCAVSASIPEGVTTAQVSVTDASGCTASVELPIVVGAAVVPGVVRDVRVERAGPALTIRWTGADAASRFRVTRGELLGLAASGALEHAADDPAGRGACDAGSGREWTDADDALDGRASLYLVLAVNDCSLAEGSPGSGLASGPIPRPARTPTASCP